MEEADINSITELQNGKNDSNNKVKMVTKIGFSFGHVFNDLCASIWFTYLIVFMNKVIGQTPLQSGIILFFGQFIDAISTPFIGYYSDKVAPRYYGKRKTWHLIGTIAVLLSFVFIYNQCFLVDENARFSNDWRVFAYYMVLVMIFQFGWAAVQLAHMAIINDISLDNQVRVGLNSLRYAFTVISSIFVYSLCWFLLSDKNQNSDGNGGITQEDWKKFMILSSVVTFVGILFSILFHIMVREKTNKKKKDEEEVSEDLDEEDLIIHSETEESISESTGNNEELSSFVFEPNVITKEMDKMTWKKWLKSNAFYTYIVCYMFSRVIVNVEQVYISLYVLDYIKLDKTMIAVSPLIIYIASFLTTFIVKYLTGKIGTKNVFLIGICLSGISGIWFFFVRFKIDNNIIITAQIVIICILVGITGTLLLVSSLAMVNDMIGANLSSSAFVLGMMSFADKILNGIVVLIIQIFIPTCSNVLIVGDECDIINGNYYRFVLTLVVTVCTIGLSIVLLVLRFDRTTFVNKSSQITTEESDVSSISM